MLKSDSWAILGLETWLQVILGDIDVRAQIWQKSEKTDFRDFAGPVHHAQLYEFELWCHIWADMTTISPYVKFQILATWICRRKAPTKSRFLRFKVVTLDFDSKSKKSLVF